MSADANLRSIGGSALRGSVAVIPRRDSLLFSISLSGTAPGTYRVAIHANGNCSSPNGFSAGPPLIFQGTGAPAVVDVQTSFGLLADVTRRVSGIALKDATELYGRSVVVHFGRSGTLDAVPDVPNDRAACGVLGPTQLLKLNL